MISFDALPGNRSLKASLRRALAGRVPQTILLSGDDSRSLETLSTALAAGILCEADGPRPCGACLSCRKVQDGVHPDLTLIDEGGKRHHPERRRAPRDRHPPCAQYERLRAECAAQGA